MNTLLFGETPRYASEGLLTGIYSEAFRSTNDIYLERAPKGLEARFKRIRNKRAIYARFFVHTFYQRVCRNGIARR